jgi:hypothetical protein
MKNETSFPSNLVKLEGLYLGTPYILEQNIRQTRSSIGVVSVERQGLISLRTSEHCKEHVFWQTCEIRLLLLAIDLNIFQWNSINEAAECCPLARIFVRSFNTEKHNDIRALCSVTVPSRPSRKVVQDASHRNGQCLNFIEALSRGVPIPAIRTARMKEEERGRRI